MSFRIDLPPEPSPRELSQKVLQVTRLLNMYHAELARILGLQCADIAAMSNARYCLQAESHAWRQAMLFVRLYNRLYDCFDGDSVAMYHWMRANNPGLGGIPHFLLVDHNGLSRLNAHLQQQQGGCRCS